MHYTREGFNNLGDFPTYRHEHTQKHNGLALGCVKLHYGFVCERACVSACQSICWSSVGDAGGSERVGVTQKVV